MGLDRVARVGQHEQLVGAHQELAGRAGHLLLAVVEREASEVAHVLGPHAEVGVHAGLGVPPPQACQALRPGGPVSLGPVGALAGRGRGGEVGRLGEPTAHM